MDTNERMIAIVGRLGVRPMVRLSLPARRLLAYLALRGMPVTRSRAASELWPDASEEIGRANLRRSLWHLPPGWTETSGDEIHLDAKCDLPDAHGVAACAVAGNAMNFDEIELLSNDILPGWYDEWLMPAQDQFHLLRVQALEAACRTMSVLGCHALATQAGSAALVAEPLRESAAEALIEAHLAQRNRYEAVRCYRSLAKRLAEELGVLPDEALAERMAAVSQLRSAA